MSIIAPKGFLRLLKRLTGIGAFLKPSRGRLPLSERELCDIGLCDDPWFGDRQDWRYRDLHSLDGGPPRFL
jgi:hypothetical protein